nr:hypothetical protein [Tanacetum cinerariifolium]
MEKLAKPLIRLLVFSRYLIMFSSLATYVPRTWFATSLESTLTWTLRTPICAAICRPAISASYSALLLEAVSIIDASGEALSGFSTRKSDRIYPFTDVCGRDDHDGMRLA